MKELLFWYKIPILTQSRSPSYIPGILVIGLLVLLSVHSINNGHNNPNYTPNYYMHDHHLGEEGSLGFAAGSKKLQQSSNLVEDLDQGVKFIPSAK